MSNDLFRYGFNSHKIHFVGDLSTIQYAEGRSAATPQQGFRKFVARHPVVQRWTRLRAGKSHPSQLPMAAAPGNQDWTAAVHQNARKPPRDASSKMSTRDRDAAVRNRSLDLPAGYNAQTGFPA